MDDLENTQNKNPEHLNPDILQAFASEFTTGEDVSQADAPAPVTETPFRFNAEMPPVLSQTPCVEQPQPRTKPKKPVLLIAIIAVLALALIGGIVWFVLANNGSGDGANGDGAREISAGKNDEGTGSETDPDPEDEIVELSLDDELVQKIFKEFAPITNPWDGETAFYAQATSGNLSRQLVMNIAFTNILAIKNYVSDGCKGDYKLDLANGEQWIITSCYSGEALRQEIAKLFGADYVFTENDALKPSCPYHYNIANDEFYQTTVGCGSLPLSGIMREPYKAERDTMRVYLYEMAAYWSQVDGSYNCDAEVCRLGNEKWDVAIDGLTVEELEQLEKLSEYPGANEIFSKFKWTFVWNGENYIFEKLERI